MDQLTGVLLRAGPVAPVAMARSSPSATTLSRWPQDR